MEAVQVDLPGLRCAGLSDAEAEAVLRCATPQEQIRLLRRARGPLLEEIHRRQQTLDRLDCLLYRLRQEETGGKRS